MGREGVCSKSGNLGGGGAKYFFSGPKCRPSRDAASLLRVGSFLLTVELFYLQLTILACKPKSSNCK